ncbi:MAG TPA: M48 family metalloprotease [Rhodocyclaceae bacterium]|nr:M48 family metalloprotease [Rhodocyclaceae bacterium]
MKKLILLAALSLPVGTLSLMVPDAFADGLPALGEASSLDFSPQMERKVGEEAMNDIRLHEAAYLDDAEVNGYLNQLVGRLSSNLEKGSQQSFETFALRDPMLNAFAMPGGFIGVHTALILAAQSESELASVLAHEISHVTQHHLARMVAPQQQSQMAALLAVAVGLLAARSRPDLAMGAMATGQAAAVQSQLSYSRDFEREADRIGLQLLERSGFDIRGMGDFFTRMDRFSRIYESNAPGYLRTHPITTERISDMENRIQMRPYKQVVDSLGFHMVRAKLRSQEGTPHDAVTDFSSILAEHKYVSEAAAHYGMARAYLRANKLNEAEQEVQMLHKLKVATPMVETLAAEIQSKRGDNAAAIKTLRAARATYGRDLAVGLQLADTLINAGRFQEALQVAHEEQQSRTTDPRLFFLQARSYAGLGKDFRQHRALADAYYNQGLLLGAVEQLQLAQKATDGDFYEQSQVDAWLRQLRDRLAAENKRSQR